MIALRFSTLRVATWLVTLAGSAAAADPAPSGLGPHSGNLVVGPEMKAAGRDLRGSRFVERDLSGADFSNADLVDVVFEDCILRNASFRGARMNGTALEGCDIAGADFTDALVDNPSRYHRPELTPDQFKSTKTYASKKLFGCLILSPPMSKGRYDFRDFSLQNCELVGDFEGSDFSGAILANAHFHGGLRFDQLATTASYKRKHFNGVHIYGMVGTADFMDVTFVDSTLHVDDQSVFENARFKGRCTLRGKFGPAQLRSTYNYRHGDLSRLRLERVDFAGFDFSGQNLSGADFFICTFAGANFDDAVISGAKFHTDRGMDQQLTADQIRATWNFKHGRMRDVELPPALSKALGIEPPKN